MNIAASLPDELNTFYARFEAHNTAHTENAPCCCRRGEQTFKRVNICKAVGPDGIPGRVLRAGAVQLAGVLTDIFNLSLSLSVVPSCFKKSTIVPIPKKNKITCLNDSRPWHPCSASVLRNSSETTSALCCLLHWIRYNLHVSATVPQTMLLPSPCSLPPGK